jgi:glycogen debranching enzyme
MNLGEKITFKEWAELISDNFEKHFYIDVDPAQCHDSRPDLVNRRGIYKDSVGAKAPWTDYQLRCNFPIALAMVGCESSLPCLFWSIKSHELDRKY